MCNFEKSALTSFNFIDEFDTDSSFDFQCKNLKVTQSKLSSIDITFFPKSPFYIGK